MKTASVERPEYRSVRDTHEGATPTFMIVCCDCAVYDPALPERPKA